MRLGLFASLVVSAAVIGDEPAAKPDPAAAAKAEVRARVEKYLAAATPGVFYSDEKDTKDGQVERVFVVGVAAISTTLGVDEGLEIAKERAEESAKAEFVKWLGSTVTVRKTVNNEILLFKEGVEAAGGVNTKESGKKVERRTKEFEETASGVVRGFRVVATHQNGKDKKFVIVYRWEAKPTDPKAGDKKPEPKKTGPTIPDKKTIIDG